jgi:predicted peroxiredoxin
VPLLRRDADRPASPGSRVPELQARLHEALELGVPLFVCPAALAQAGLSPGDLLPEVTGIRGAAALLASGFAPDTRMITP